ncbi:MAG: NAD(P)-binding protein [Actinophytocola sp.]|nr:NAD(P)-binding protein [Actinophytocola sp.]
MEVVVIGGGQAGLSAGYFLRRSGFVPERDYVLLDHSPSPGGAWQFRWPALRLSPQDGSGATAALDGGTRVHVLAVREGERGRLAVGPPADRQLGSAVVGAG